MNKLKTILALIAIASAGVGPLSAQQRVNSSGGASPHETTGGMIGGRGGNRVTITYGRPYAKAPRGGEVRKIWGTLVPWGKAWRLGSDEATTLITQQPIAFGDLVVPAGAYTLYMVPMETGASKLAISKKIGQWGIPVDETQDLGRVDLKKDTLDTAVDQLTIAVVNDQAAGGGVIKISWENAVYSVPFTVKK